MLSRATIDALKLHIKEKVENKMKIGVLYLYILCSEAHKKVFNII